MKSKLALIIELQEKALKLCICGDNRGKPVIKKCEILDTSALDSLARLEGIIAQNKFYKIIAVLPRQLFLMRYLSVPSEDKKEIKGMLKFQLTKTVPFSLDEAGYDFSILTTKEGVSKLLVFILQEKNSGPVWDILSRGARAPAVFTINSQGLYSWTKRLGAEAAESPIATIEIDKDCVNFCVVGEDRLLFSRSFGHVRSEDIREGITQSLRLYDKELPQAPVKKMIFTGIRRDEVVAKFPGAIFIEWGQGSVLEPGVDDQGYSFASLAGFLGGSGVEWVDFPLPRLMDQKRNYHRKKNIFNFSIIACEMVCILGILFGKMTIERLKYLDHLNSELSQLKVASPNIESMVGRLKALDSQSGAKPFFSEVLGNIFSALPDGAKVSLIDVQNDGEFSLKGYVTESSQAFKLAAALNNTGTFKDVSVKYASKNGESASSGIEFNIAGKIR